MRLWGEERMKYRVTFPCQPPKQRQKFYTELSTVVAAVEALGTLCQTDAVIVEELAWVDATAEFQSLLATRKDKKDVINHRDNKDV